MGILHLRALAEDGIRLVEEQDTVDPIGLDEDPVEVLLGLADVLVHDRRQVDDIEVKAEIGGNNLGRHRLAHAGVARKEPGDALAARRAGTHAPRVEHPLPVACPGGQLPELDDDVVGQHEVTPVHLRADAPREALQAGCVLRPGTHLEVRRRECPVLGDGLTVCSLGGPEHLLRGEAELTGRRSGVKTRANVPVQRRQPHEAPLVRADRRRPEDHRYPP